MSAIAYFLEREGIATTGISLVRENTVSFAPPRFLWVSFPLGRPLGEPGNEALQHRVITRALALLERGQGPVLEDFPEHLAPGQSDTSLVCPVSFAAQDAQSDDRASRLHREVTALLPWYEAGREARRRTSFGILGETPVDLARQLAVILDEQQTPGPGIKHLLEDLKAFYTESMLEQPGASALDLNRWLWLETELGQCMQALPALMQDADDARTRAVATAIVPRWVREAAPSRS